MQLLTVNSFLVKKHLQNVSIRMRDRDEHVSCSMDLIQWVHVSIAAKDTRTSSGPEECQHDMSPGERLVERFLSDSCELSLTQRPGDIICLQTNTYAPKRQHAVPCCEALHWSSGGVGVHNSCLVSPVKV